MMTQKVIEIVCDAADIPPEWIGPDTDLVEASFLDSLDMLEIFEEIEEAFGVEIPDEATEELRTVNDIVTYLKRC